MMKRRFEIVLVIIIVSLLILMGIQSHRCRRAISTEEMVEKLRDSYSNGDDSIMENSFICDAHSNNIDLFYN